MDFGWLWCVSVGSFLVTNVPLLWVTHSINGDAMHCAGGGIQEIPAPSSQFCCKPKTSLKNKVLKNVSMLVRVYDSIKKIGIIKQLEINTTICAKPLKLYYLLKAIKTIRLFERH